MKNTWEDAQEMADRHIQSGGGRFVRLANHGDKVVGAFVGEPLAREVHWTGEKYVECIGKGCSICESGKKPAMRVSMNFFVPADNEMKIIEGGTAWFKDLVKVKKKYGLDKWFFEIERNGQAGDSKTRYTILPEQQISEQQREKIDSTPLHNLSEAVSAGSSDNFDSYDRESDATIDDATVRKLMPRLKALPRTSIDRWLGKLGIDKVRELKTRDLEIAEKLLEQLESEHQPATVSSEDIDPFA